MLVLLLFINCSLNWVKTPRKVCTNSPYSKEEKQTKNTLRGASKLHAQRRQTNGLLLRELGKRGKFQPATLRRCFAEAPTREGQIQGPGLQSSAAELLSWKRNLKYYQLKRKHTRRMSFKCNHTAKTLFIHQTAAVRISSLWACWTTWSGAKCLQLWLLLRYHQVLPRY